MPTLTEQLTVIFIATAILAMPIVHVAAMVIR